ncbi:hypothetical protein PR003_g9837 [Phytophthora rubi]|uniref:Uncharacterized protein n=1 Tax=Phytophthora rubi TaxID=129364 RepID=A0A6A3JJ59_9STRA|nr:hypothetical protein PR002_g19767 [Phytophthora rubi]KAE8996357.1 hypothetical protein PR001_g19883 [Phytophthora rubi]KAE9341705.1 hypothetical protein PR003_g9837 [Phytophthora rubi]
MAYRSYPVKRGVSTSVTLFRQRAAASDGLPLWLWLRPREIPAHPDFQRAHERLCNGEDCRGLIASDEPSAGNDEKAGDKND